MAKKVYSFDSFGFTVLGFRLLFRGLVCGQGVGDMFANVAQAPTQRSASASWEESYVMSESAHHYIS